MRRASPGRPATAAAERPAAVRATGCARVRCAAAPTRRCGSRRPPRRRRSAVSPRVMLSLIGGLLAGLLLGVAGAFALSALDTRREREDRLRRPRAHDPRPRSRPAPLARGSHAFEEAFRFLRTALRFASSDHPYSTIAITSAAEREGKTTTSAQLAFAALEAGQTVILVEVDAYRPALQTRDRAPARGRARRPRPARLSLRPGVARRDRQADRDDGTELRARRLAGDGEHHRAAGAASTAPSSRVRRARRSRDPRLPAGRAALRRDPASPRSPTRSCSSSTRRARATRTSPTPCACSAARARRSSASCSTATTPRQREYNYQQHPAERRPQGALPRPEVRCGGQEREPH